MPKHEREIQGHNTWVITEPISKMLPDNSGYQEDGFLVRFGLEGQIGNYINNGKPHIKFPTEPQAMSAGFAALERLFIP